MMKIPMKKHTTMFCGKALLSMKIIRPLLLKSLFMIFEPISSIAVPNIYTPLSTPPVSDVFENILKEPIIKLSQTPPPPLPISTFVPIKSSIQPLLKSLSEPTSYIKPLYHFSLRSSLTPQ